MAYEVEFEAAAKREFDRADARIRARILRALARLVEAPFESPNVKALGGEGYRLRVGDWRVL